MTEVELGYKLNDFLFKLDRPTNPHQDDITENQDKSRELINIIKENSGSDERYKNTLDKYKKAYLDNINISLGIAGLGILIFYHYK